MKKDCGNNKPCGCEDKPLTTPPPCQNDTPSCPEPDNCSETFSQECIVWTNEDLECNGTLIATSGDRMDVVLQRLVTLICNNNDNSASESSIDLIIPAPNETIIGSTERLITVDRNNCHEIITFNPIGAPAGLLFDYVDENNTTQTNQTAIVLASTQSSIVFDINTTGVSPGNYNFTLEATTCGINLVIDVFITVS